MFRIIIVLACITCVAFSCNQTAKTKETLTGKVLTLAPNLDKQTCSVVGDGGPCTSVAVLMDSQKFFVVSYCEPNRDYYKGSYKVDDNNGVALVFDSLMVSAISNGSFYTYKGGIIEPFTLSYKRIKCGDQFLYQSDKEYAGIDTGRNYQAEVAAIKENGVWEMLKMD